MTKKELTTIIKNYVKEHKELQTPTVFYMDVKKACKELNIEYYYMNMMLIKYSNL